MAGPFIKPSVPDPATKDEDAVRRDFADLVGDSPRQRRDSRRCRLSKRPEEVLTAALVAGPLFPLFGTVASWPFPAYVVIVPSGVMRRITESTPSVKYSVPAGVNRHFSAVLDLRLSGGAAIARVSVYPRARIGGYDAVRRHSTYSKVIRIVNIEIARLVHHCVAGISQGCAAGRSAFARKASDAIPCQNCECSVGIQAANNMIIGVGEDDVAIGVCLDLLKTG